MSTSNVSSTSCDEESTYCTKNYCLTNVKVVKCSCEWTINNLSFCLEEDEDELQSAPFSADTANEIEWGLRIKVDEDDEDFLTIFLVLISSKNKSDVRAKYKVSILNAKGAPTSVMEAEKTHKFKQGTGCQEDISKEVIGDGLQDDKLTIYCEISMVSDIINISAKNEVKIPMCRLSNDLEDLFDSKRFSDVTLAVGDKEFQAHKAILTARSPVFAAMFEHNMEESKRNRVEITDVDPDTLKEMLHFMYTGRASNIEKMADSLLTASDKYALERLKVMCEEALYQHLSVESAANTLILAEKHSADQLKAAVINFINNYNAADVMDTDGWKSVVSSHQHLILDAFRSLVIQNNKKA